ncbi:MAG: hypothetical protein EOO46_01160 [Flavobacterium sp.]|nr:MAG: hypothetical protein EOO46_01160 [Flavobacterium sp.]
MSAPHYFQQYDGYFWQWEDEGEVISITEGNTIAYRPYIAEILQRLADPGLPPFGSLLLVLIATNPQAEASLMTVRRVVEKALERADYLGEPLKSALAYLTQLSSLPVKYKQGKNRQLLLQTLFADCHNRLSHRSSETVCHAFATANKVIDEWSTPQPFFYNLYHEDFRVVELLSRRFSTMEKLIDQLAAFPLIDEEIVLEPREGVGEDEKDFIETLVENSKTFHVGSLVKRLCSGLNIPHHNSLPSQQPLGGVSDLTNKGEFHRLLISEFANEDILFLSRLANNEALYINREVPPQNNDLERMILIDVSIKNWGTPKTIAYALLLAIAKHPKTDIACSAYVVGEECKQIRFETIDDIIDALQILEPCLHPAQGLQAFLKEYGNKKNKEMFFISSTETYRQSSLHKVISDHYNSFNYWIQTDAEGNVDLYRRQQNSKKHVQHLQLPLTELWKKEQKAKYVKQEEKEDNADRFHYPILFPAANPKKVMVANNGEVFAITSEWSLIRLYDKTAGYRKGWELICEGLPRFSGDACIGITDKAEVLLLFFNESNRKVTILNVESDFARSIHFHDWEKTSGPAGFLFHGNHFIFSNSDFEGKWWTFFLNDQIVLHTENTPDLLLREKWTAMRQKQQAVYYSRAFVGSVFKNIKEIWINQVGNLVFSKRELRLTDQGQIRMERSGFQQKEVEARHIGKKTFKFPDGSTVTVNPSGMLVLKSSNESLETIYVPSSTDALLGVATTSSFAGLDYYLPDDHGGGIIEPKLFWKQFINPFIETIRSHGA